MQVQVETGINIKQIRERKHPASSFRSLRSANRTFKKESRKKKASCTHHQRSQEREQDIQKGIKKKESILYPSSKVPGARAGHSKRNQEKKKASCTHHQKSQEREQDIQKGVKKKRKHPVPIIKDPRSASRTFKKESGKKESIPPPSSKAPRKQEE